MSTEKPVNMIHDPLAWLTDEDDEIDNEISQNKATEIVKPDTQAVVETAAIVIEDVVPDDDWGLFADDDSEVVEHDLSTLLDDGWGLFDDDDEAAAAVQASNPENDLEEDDDWGMFSDDDDIPDVALAVVEEVEMKPVQVDQQSTVATDEPDLERDGWGLFSDGDDEHVPAANPKGAGWGLFVENLPDDMEGEVIILPESLTIKEVEDCWHNVEGFIKGDASDKIHLDASLVEYIDGAGIQLIYVIKHYSEDFGKGFHVIRPSEIVRNAIDVAG